MLVMRLNYQPLFFLNGGFQIPARFGLIYGFCVSGSPGSLQGLIFCSAGIRHPFLDSRIHFNYSYMQYIKTGLLPGKEWQR
jgi:hypothetical protein